jgi:hypothetical protein
MDIVEKEYVVKVINYFSDANIVTAERVNNRVATLAYKALQDASMCSAAMDIVPRPTDSAPNITRII